MGPQSPWQEARTTLQSVTDLLADRYELGRGLGRGGMAQVREAIDHRLGRRVAIKLLAGGAADGLRARFLREARLAAQFTHPHAVMVFDAGEDRDVLFLAMELVDGPSLARVLARRGMLEATEAVAVTEQVLAAVGAAHEAGLVHRDIKPSNILFTQEGVAKLADFGIAKSMGQLSMSLTATGQMIGTPQYLSPEQAAGEDAVPASDLYAAGVVLFEMLTGSPPFAGDTPLATALAHQQAPVPSVTARRPDVDPDLAAVVQRALAKSPQQRYPDAAAMRAALADPAAAAQAQAHRAEATTATLPSTDGATSDRSAGWPKRRVLVGSLALFAAIVAVVTALSSGNGDDPVAAPGAGPVATPSTTAPTTTTTTEPPTTTTTAPPTIGALTDVLMGNVDGYGEKGKDLLDELQDVQSEGDDKRAKEARKAIEEIEEWLEDGEIDPEIARHAVDVLEAIG
jgi:eukaryotic-like serine/threonine-protein kinase